MAQPTEWSRRPLRELTLSTTTWNPHNRPREFIQYVDVSAISREELRILNAPAIPAISAPSRARKIVQTGDTIFATVRPTLKRIAQIPASLDREIVSTAFCVLRPDRQKISPDFLFFAIQVESVMSRIAALETGASYPAVRDSDVLAQSIPVPPLREQLDIAVALKAARAALLHEAECEAASIALKSAAMRDLFTRGLRAEALKETEIGLIPASWNAKHLGAFFQIKHGFAFDGTQFRTDGAYVLLTPGHFSEQGGFRDQGEKTKHYVGDFDQQYLLQPGSLLVAMTEQKPGLLGSSAIIPGGRKYLHNQRLGLITQLDEERLDKGYLYHLFNHGPVRDEISRTSTGSKVKHTSPQRIREIVAPIPALEEQREIAAVFAAIDRKIDLHRKKRALLDELFKALLHKLMTGEIRVGDLDLSALAPARVAEAAQ
jgi:type I restriction enzyme, S subunit